MTSIKVLFITHYSSLYGANRSLLGLLDGIDKSGIEPYVLLPNDGELIDELKKREITYLKFPFKNWMATSRIKAPLRFIMNLVALPILLTQIKKWDIDLIHTNSSVTPIGAWLAHIARVYHIWHIREFGWEDYRLKYDLGLTQFKYWLDKADHIITVSKALQTKVLKGISTPSTVIYNGVISKEKVDTLKEEYQSKGHSNKTIFGIIGLLSLAKGQEQAIRAFHKISEFYNTELWIAGSGKDEYEGYLRQLAKELKIDKDIEFLGYIDEPFEFYSEIDVALVCSKNEGMGRVTAEAMIAEKPIIGLDNAGTSELIEDKKTGLLYDGSIDSLVSKMEYFINNNSKVIAQNARKKGLKLFLVEQYASQVKKVINSVASEYR